MRLPLALGLSLFVLPVHAELSPQVYQEMQAAAPEALRLKITGVDRAFTQGHTKKAELVRAKAVVLEVTRTATGLAPGKEVALRYVHDPLAEGMVGPGPTPIVVRTAEYEAFLRAGDQGVYAPAAKRASFRQVKPPEAGVATDAPDRVTDVTGSPAYLLGLAALLAAILTGLGFFLKRRQSGGDDDHDPEEDMATQFRVAPVLRPPED
jgi:hypothetical protein